MQAAYYTKRGTAREVLEIGTVPTPDPKPGEVRVRLQTSGVNPSDVKMRQAGSPRPMPGDLVIPHSDGAGVVDAVGEGVDASRIGERVWIWNAGYRRAEGSAAQYVSLPAAQAVGLPGDVDMAVGACLGIPALTAWRAVTIDGGVAGRNVLISGGAGSVGHYAVQMAKLKGAAQVIATVSSPEKADIAREAGADATIDYRREDVAARVRELTEGRGADRIVEVAFDANVGLLPDALAPHGDVVVYGMGAREVTIPAGALMQRNNRLLMILVYELLPADRRAALEDLTRMLAADALIHNVALRCPLSEIAAAHEAVERGTLIGNVVLDIP
ncbi:MAG: NADPH:quinone reductase [Alphaproteobacteria bacterium]